MLPTYPIEGPRLTVNPKAPAVTREAEEVEVMSQLLLQVVIVVAFGAVCFGCGYGIAFIVERNRWRDEMIKRNVARYNWQTGKWEWGEPPR
jgi:hypothetical protein